MNYLEMFGAIVGFIYLWLEYRASIWLWPVGIILPAVYIVIYFNAGIYANLGINIYYLLAAAYGWYYWLYGGKRQQVQGNQLMISEMPSRYYVPLTVIFILLFFAIVWWLKQHTDSTVPLIDGFTTALSIIGMWMLARKFIEQWWIWVVVDAVSCVLYINKMLYFTFALFAVSTVIALFGYFKWKRMMLSQQVTAC